MEGRGLWSNSNEISMGGRPGNMKKNWIGIFYIAVCSMSLANDEAMDAVAINEKHASGSEGLADEQDELSADVQQLVIEQTVQQVIDLLTEVEGIMGETTDYLAERDTGGKTIAAQTEIIEKIHAAAKAKQGSDGSSEEGSAMMDMMERMMGMKPGEKEGGEGKESESKGKGEGEGAAAGNGNGGDSDSENQFGGGEGADGVAARRVPKAAGTAGRSLPPEFREALDAYNRGLEP